MQVYSVVIRFHHCDPDQKVVGKKIFIFGFGRDLIFAHII